MQQRESDKMSTTTLRPTPGGVGCVPRIVGEKLRRAGLRPTRQRLALGWLLFGKGDRHLTAEQLYEEARAARVNMSLATVYNTLRQFTESGLLREVALFGSKVWYDTTTGPHYHYYVEDRDEVFDIPETMLPQLTVPGVPEGMVVAGVDVIVRLKKAP
jgi:Fur family iron response transcriptional regulator